MYTVPKQGCALACWSEELGIQESGVSCDLLLGNRGITNPELCKKSVRSDL